ncbi:MAG: uroporphyrinogen decarboxylase family protein [Eubacteriales bacterium]
MTGKQRVLAALNFQQPDLIPWGEHCIDYNIFELVLKRPSLVHAKFKEIRAYWEGRRDEVVDCYMRDYIDLAQALDMDLLTVFPVPPKGYVGERLKDLGSNRYQDSSGNLYMYSDKTEDLMKIPLNTAYFQYDISYEEICEKVEWAKGLPPTSSENDNGCYDPVKHVVKEIGEYKFIITPINGIEWPRFGISEEDSWINLMLYPEVCEKIAEYQYLLTVRELDKIKALGVDGVLSAGDLGNTTNLAASPDFYRRITLKYHQRIYEECKKRGLYVIRHCCGHIWPIIDEIALYNDSYEGIQERAGMDISKLSKHLENRLCLWGGVLHEHIHGGTATEVEADVKRTCELSKKYGGIILGSSHSLSIGATYENIMSIKNCREKYGR